MWWIKASIQEYILRSWSLVKIGTTTAQKKLFFNLKKIKNQIAPQTEGDLRDEHVNEIANKLDVSKDEVVSMNRRLSGKEFSLNAQVGEDGDEWQDWLVDKELDHDLKFAHQEEMEQRKDLLKNSIKVLNEREKEILYSRRLNDNPTTLEDLSKKHKISRERVRQIENKAFEKLQKQMLLMAKSKNLLPVN
jgi:RNA polymerase sigma-32 factor